MLAARAAIVTHAQVPCPQVRGYRRLLREKRLELGDKANKLKGGLQKLDETSVQVRTGPPRLPHISPSTTFQPCAPPRLACPHTFGV